MAQLGSPGLRAFVIQRSGRYLPEIANHINDKAAERITLHN